MTHVAAATRRDLLLSAGALVVSFALTNRTVAEVPQQATEVPRDVRETSSWIAIGADNRATLYLSKSELGQGITTGLLQVACEELDLDMEQMAMAPVDTFRSPRQAPTVASMGISEGGPQVRAAAAEARRKLLELASVRLQASVSDLTVAAGVVAVKGDQARSVNYGDLVGGQPFDIKVTGNAPVKAVGDYRLVGKSVPRVDIPAKISGEYVYMHHVRVPGMLHGRVVRPAGQGAFGSTPEIRSVSASSIADIKEVSLLRRGNFLVVVGLKEWDVVRAVNQIQVEWDIPSSLPGSEQLHAKMRSEETIDKVIDVAGDVRSAVGGAAYVATGSFDGPYQAQAPFGPNCAIADVRSDNALVICSTQDVFKTAEIVSKVIGMNPGRIRVKYYEGSGTFGHSGYHDAAQAAAIASQLAGAPVRVQLMRHDEHGYNNYGPAQCCDVRVAADKAGNLTSFEFNGWQHCWADNEASELLAMGSQAKERPPRPSMTVRPTICSMYKIPSRKLVNHQVPARKGYLRGSYLRSPLDIGFCFAAEQAIDELARLARMDPVEFRLRNMHDPRWLAVLDAAANAAGWSSREAFEPLAARLVRGWGVGVGGHYGDVYSAAVAQVEVNLDTGDVVAKRIYGAMDAGLIVNPAAVRSQMVGMMTQATSRVLKEEVTFDERGVTSLEWDSYPTLRFAESPKVVPILLQRVDVPPAGAGENLMGPVAAAIANAFFDATGSRMRRYPMTRERVKAALASLPQ